MKLKVTLSCCVLFLLSGCISNYYNSINYVREAQTAFNEAAAIDNSDVTVTLQSAEAGYAAAIAAVNGLEADDEALETAISDNLYGIALTIKALSHWKLRNWDASLAAQQNALTRYSSNRDSLGTRDLVLLNALPSLIKHGQEVSRLNQGVSFTCTGSVTSLDCTEGSPSFANVTRQLQEALGELVGAIESAPPSHPVRFYLAASAVGVLETGLQACQQVRLNGRPLNESTIAVCRDNEVPLSETSARTIASNLCAGRTTDQGEALFQVIINHYSALLNICQA